MSSAYRLVVHCDEQKTDRCHGLVEYSSPDRLDLARKSDDHLSGSGWLRGYTAKGTYDVCPQCRKLIPPWGQPEKEKANA